MDDHDGQMRTFRYSLRHVSALDFVNGSNDNPKGRRFKSHLSRPKCMLIDIATTHNATHNKSDLHVLRRTYSAVRDLQVVEGIGQLHSEKAALSQAPVVVKRR